MFINCANIPKTHQKHSSDYDEYTCPRRCSEAYYPLCGINQAGDTKVFVNDCYMSMENCNQLAQQGMQDVFFALLPEFHRIQMFFCIVFHLTDESDCADFEEWISDDTIRKKLNI